MDEEPIAMSPRITTRRLTIADLSHLTQKSIATLHTFEEHGLLPKVRGANGEAVYDENAVAAVRAVRQLLEVGLSLPQVSELFETADHGGALFDVEEMIHERRVELRETIGEMIQLDRSLVASLAYLQKKAVR